MKETSNSLSVVVPTIGRKSLDEAIKSCGDIPVITERDPHRTGAGPSRNRAVQRVATPWCAFLDDDDSYAVGGPERVKRTIEENPDADCIIFRAKFPDGRLLPKTPRVEWGNIPISFAVKTELAKKYPFVKGYNAFRENEDYRFVKTLEDNGAKIVFSTHVTYLVKASQEAQKTAVINRRKK